MRFYKDHTNSLTVGCTESHNLSVSPRYIYIYIRRNVCRHYGRRSRRVVRPTLLTPTSAESLLSLPRVRSYAFSFVPPPSLQFSFLLLLSILCVIAMFLGFSFFPLSFRPDGGRALEDVRGCKKGCGPGPERRGVHGGGTMCECAPEDEEDAGDHEGFGGHPGNAALPSCITRTGTYLTGSRFLLLFSDLFCLESFDLFIFLKVICRF